MNLSLHRLSMDCPWTLRKLARPTGLEPVTLGLEGRCSIHLSYGRREGIARTFATFERRACSRPAGAPRRERHSPNDIVPLEHRTRLAAGELNRLQATPPGEVPHGSTVPSSKRPPSRRASGERTA
jgi:hypothetical protein